MRSGLFSSPGEVLSRQALSRSGLLRREGGKQLRVTAHCVPVVAGLGSASVGLALILAAPGGQTLNERVDALRAAIPPEIGFWATIGETAGVIFRQGPALSGDLVAAALAFVIGLVLCYFGVRYAIAIVSLRLLVTHANDVFARLALPVVFPSWGTFIMTVAFTAFGLFIAILGLSWLQPNFLASVGLLDLPATGS